jgi:chaperonin GroEL
MHRVIDAIRPTLGPYPRVVAVAPRRARSARALEMLDDGGMIARRITRLPNQNEDAGAAYIREILWNQRAEVGDGIATTAVIFQTVYDEGLRYLASGGNPALLRTQLNRGLRVIEDELEQHTMMLQGRVALSQLAESICHDAHLAKLMGEIFDIIGEYGTLQIGRGQGRVSDREYSEGLYWQSGVLSRTMLSSTPTGVEETGGPVDVSDRVRLENPAILITDMPIERQEDLIAIISRAVEAEIKALLVVTPRIARKPLTLLVANQKQGNLKVKFVAVRTPLIRSPKGGQRSETSSNRSILAMQDMAILTGARPLLVSTGDRLTRVSPQDFGRARRVWADRSSFGIIGGRGDPRKLRQHIADLRTAFEHTRDAKTREQLRERIGKLMGGTATLKIGGLTEAEIAERMVLAKRTSSAMRAAMAGAMRNRNRNGGGGGVVPGGGVALLTCRPALQRAFAHDPTPEAQAAFRILSKALETPIRTLLHNAGVADPGEILAELARLGPEYGCNVKTGEIVDMTTAGIFDVAGVLKAAVHSAVGGAALALTVDALIHS